MSRLKNKHYDMYDLIRVSTKDKLYLHGLYSAGSKDEPVILFVHGLGGNFYENYFVQVLGKEVSKNNIAFLSGNNRGNGSDTTFLNTDGEFVRIGSRYELLEDAHQDITAWIKFLIDKGYSQIILTGHSAGTVKVVRYLFEGELKNRVSKLILLSPIDSLGYRIAHGRNNIESFLEKAQAKVDEGKGEELVTTEFDHDILSYQTFISWYKRDDFGRMFEFCDRNYDFSVLKKVSVPTSIIVGTKDEYFHPASPEHPEDAMSILLKNIPSSEGEIIQNANHGFINFERELSKIILDNIKIAGPLEQKLRKS